MRNFQLVISAVWLAATAHAQVRTFGGPGSEQIFSTSHDAAGNSYHCGIFSGTVDFDPSDGPDAGDTFSSEFGAGFVLSQTPAGAFRHVHVYQDAGGVAAVGTIRFDSSGNSFIAGEIYGTVDLDRGPGTANRTGDTDGDGFFASFTPAGALRFAHVLGGPGYTASGALAIAPGGNITLLGAVQGSVDVDPGATSLTFTSAGGYDGYIAGFSNAGAFLYGRQFTGTGNISVSGIEVDASGNAFVSGNYSGTADFDGADGQGPDDTRTSANGTTDLYLASYTSSGALRFVHGFPGNFSDTCHGIAVDSAGNCFITGWGAQMDLDPGPATLSVPSTSNFFLASYSNSGALRFAVAEDSPGIGSATPRHVVCHGGDVYVAGQFRGVVNIAPADPQSRGVLATGATTDIGFAARFSGTDGGIVWARAFGSHGTVATTMDIAADGTPLIVGTFRGTADFDPGIGVVERTSAGQDDAFLLRLESDGDYPGAVGGGLVVTHTGDSGPGSLREAIATANLTAARDTITFAIPGAGPHVISPASPLPEIVFPLEIDGLSQPGSSSTAWPPTLRIVLSGTNAGAGADGIRLGKTVSGDQFLANSTIRGLVVRNFSGAGISLGRGARLTVVRECFIGTTPDGTTAAPNAGGGVVVDTFGRLTGSDIHGIRIGQPGAGNLISGNGGAGVLLKSCEGVAVQGNFIGTNPAGTAGIPNALDGVLLIGDNPDSKYNLIGGTAAGEGNRIAFNSGDGVALGPVSHIDVLGNSISDNAGIGIDHFNTGGTNGPLLGSPSPNDPGDTDSDLPNDKTNFPLLRRALLEGSVTRVIGELDGTPGETFRLEFFSSPAADPSGYGEARTFLGHLIHQVADGPTLFIAELPAVAAGQFISATSTSLRRLVNSREGTSEISLVVPVETVTVTTAADSGAGSLRSAIIAANSNPGADTITLSPALAGQTFSLTTALPTITGPLVLRGAPGVILSGRNAIRPLLIDAPGQQVTIEDLTIANGSSAQDGGGILVSAGTLVMNRCAILDCTSGAAGGGLALANGTTATLADCHISGCEAQTDGGGIARLGTGNLTADRCTLDNCTAGNRGGGAFVNSTTAIFRNATFSGNQAATGGGVHSQVLGLRLSFCTVVHNIATVSGGGVSGAPTGSSDISSCILSLNSAPADPQIPGIASHQTRNLVGTDPLVGPLRDNGGWVPTHALLTASPARDQVTPGNGLDARLAPRRNALAVGVVSNVSDYGAFEYFTGPYGEFARNYASWRTQSGAGPAEADDNGDGLANIAARYLGQPVTGPSAGRGWEFRRDGSGALVLTYSRPFHVIGTTAVGEVSTQLSGWSAGPAPVEIGSSTQRIFYEVTLPPGGPAKFLRLRIEE
jgi:hypothetical protein